LSRAFSTHGTDISAPPPAAAARLVYLPLPAVLLKKELALSTAHKLDERRGHLIAIPPPAIKGFAFCVDMHSKQARMHGERELRLHHLVIWRESQLFTPRERAALAWTEALTRLAHDGVSDALYESMLDHFSESELSDLTFRVAAINGWNRMSIAFRNPPGSRDKMFGLDKAGLS